MAYSQCAKNHWIAYLKWENFMTHELYLNKVVILKMPWQEGEVEEEEIEGPTSSEEKGLPSACRSSRGMSNKGPKL